MILLDIGLKFVGIWMRALKSTNHLRQWIQASYNLKQSFEPWSVFNSPPCRWVTGMSWAGTVCPVDTSELI